MLDVLRRVACGELTPEEAAAVLRAGGVLRLGDVASLDLDRAARTGVPEVVLAGAKRPGEVAAIVGGLLDAVGSACVSRMRAGHRRAVAMVASSRGARMVDYGRRSCRVLARPDQPERDSGLVGLISAGTADAEALAETRMVCEAAGCAVATVTDVGVAGIARLFEPLAGLVRMDVDALVVAAGMDGVLPTVVAGLVAVPVIGLPTSTGYGAGGRGEAALLAMLQSCAPGLSVVNIDNGVGAGAVAALIARRRTVAVRATLAGAPVAAARR
jgi:pyridinium-3,5-biscarboxylic acid mononucleotide synthase